MDNKSIAIITKLLSIIYMSGVFPEDWLKSNFIAHCRSQETILKYEKNEQLM